MEGVCSIVVGIDHKETRNWEEKQESGQSWGKKGKEAEDEDFEKRAFDAAEGREDENMFLSINC